MALQLLGFVGMALVVGEVFPPTGYQNLEFLCGGLTAGYQSKSKR